MLKDGQIVQGIPIKKITDEVFNEYSGNPDKIFRDANQLFPATSWRLGAAAANSAITKMSPPRIAMAHHLMAASVTMVNGERNIIHNGTHKLLSETCFNVLIGTDSTYMGMVVDKNKEIANYTIFLKDSNDTIYHLEVPAFNIYEKKFGFRLTPTKLFKRLMDAVPGTFKLKKGDILATSPSYGNGSFKAYANGNVAFMTDPIVDQDAIIISDRLAKKMAIERYMEYEFKVSKDEIPLNVHGDEYSYKSLLEPGDEVPDSNILFAKRTDRLITDKQLRTVIHPSDSIYTAHHNGGKVVSVTVVKPTTRSVEEIWTEQLDRWCDRNQDLSKDYVNRVEEIEKSGNKKWRGTVIPEYAKHKIMSTDRYKLFKKREPITNYYIKIIVRHTVIARPTTKVTTPDGGKGEITQVLPLEMMPQEENGEYTDIIIHRDSTMNRMIMTRPHLAFIGSAVYRVGKSIKEKIIATCSIHKIHKYPDLVNEQFSRVAELQRMVGNGFYETYLEATFQDKIDILKEVYGKSRDSDSQLTLNLDVANALRTEEIIANMEKAGVMPPQTTVVQKREDGTVIKYNNLMRLGRIAVFPVNKWGDDGISTSIPVRTNTGRPARLNSDNKHLSPNNTSSLRMLAESDTQIVQAGTDTETLAELNDRTGNPETSIAVCRAIFETDGPIEVAVDRDKIPFGNTIVNAAERHIYGLTGYGLEYHKTATDTLKQKYNRALRKEKVELMDVIRKESK